MNRMAQISLLIAVVILGLTMVGCADDLYGECTISDEEEGLEQCLQSSDSQSVSCVVSGQIECQSGACGKYRGSSAFCTRPCQEDGDCPSGRCREFVMRVEGSHHCVADQFLPRDE